MKMMKKLSCLFLVLMLVIALPVQALAETYYLEDGSVVVTTDESSQYVAQGANNAVAQTTETVITQRAPETPTSNTVTIDTTTNAGAKPAEVIIQDVNISTSGTAIDVGASSATINVSGNNTVTTTGSQDAAIHVTSGDLTINGSIGDSLTVTASTATSAGGAAIGTDHDNGEELSGSITISGGNITANGGGNSAAIGTGKSSSMADGASINITGGNVVANGGHAGAAIGAGHVSSISDDAEINISGGTVAATGGQFGAGIGTTDTDGVYGKINIFGGDVTAVGGDDAPGIGGDNIGEYGVINISGGTVTAVGGRDSAGIGAYRNLNYESKISIGGDADVIAQAGPGKKGTPCAIGSGLGSVDKYAEIIIDGNATVTLANGGTLPDEAEVSSNATVTTTNKTYQEVLDARKPAPQPEPTPTPKPAPQPVSIAMVEKVTSSEPSYWDSLVWTLNQAEEGTTLTLDLGYHTWIPRTVIQAAQAKNITLILKWQGGDDITITPTDTIDLTLWQVNLKDLV